MAEVMLSIQAYCKMLLHAFKYPHCALNGVFLARKPKTKEEKATVIIDAIPLFHINLGLTPMLEAALLQIDQYCKSENLVIVGYYQANENYKENTPDVIANRIADKVCENFPSACMVIIDNQKLSLDCDSIPFSIYHNQDGKWVPRDASSVHLEMGSEALDVACKLLHSKLYREIYDFDNHLDDISFDWLNPEINSKINDIS